MIQWHLALNCEPYYFHVDITYAVFSNFKGARDTLTIVCLSVTMWECLLLAAGAKARCSSHNEVNLPGVAPHHPTTRAVRVLFLLHHAFAPCCPSAPRHLPARRSNPGRTSYWLLADTGFS